MKYSVKVGLQATKSESRPIRIRVSFDSQRVDIALGYSYEPDCWDADTGYPRKRTKNLYNQTAAEVTMAINDKLDVIDKYFQRCDLDSIEPQATELKRLCGARMRATKETITAYCNQYLQVLQQRHYTSSTYKRLENTLNGFCQDYADTNIQDIDEDILVDWANTLVERGTNNSSIVVYCNAVKNFLKWLIETAGLKLTLNSTHLRTIHDDARSYLEADELKAFYQYEPVSNGEQTAKDYFILGCFSGLRYVDLHKLKKNEISDTEICTNCKKTGKNVRIEINKYSREIIDKYKDSPSLYVLPRISCSWLDMLLWRIFIRLGFDTPINIEYYNGKNLIQKEVPKYEILASHSARRTFVVQCLTRGVPPLVVIRWTGHKDLKSLGPYIAIADSQRKEEMDKLNVDL